VKNGNEADIDCGGLCLPSKQCANGLACNNGADCISGVCTGKICQAGTCNDGVQNADETGIDCGGRCASQNKCADKMGCVVSNDCSSGICTSNICETPNCNDGIRNGNEAGIDCGGSCVPSKLCGSGSTCNHAFDCISGVCTGNICQTPTCKDGIQNADETDRDCGGWCASQKKCADKMRCRNSSDCSSGVCQSNTCQAPTCNDGVKNGNEAGVDCGGSCLSYRQCSSGSTCTRAADCISGVCKTNICQAPTCDDGIQNADETDIDCGGWCAPYKRCCFMQGCRSGYDCKISVCWFGYCIL
jgi:hypothetical protein